MTKNFTPPADGWFHIAPFGTFPHNTGTMQVLDHTAADSIVATFAEEAQQPNFPGLLVDFDHFSHDPNQPTAAAGWITALQKRENGLHAQIRFSDLGQQALAGGRYRLVSPVWNRADCEEWTAPVQGRDLPHLRPRRLDRLALTNDPNLPGLTPLTNRSQLQPDKSVSLNPQPNSKKPPILMSKKLFQNTNFRAEILRGLNLPSTISEVDLSQAVHQHFDEIKTLRNRLAQLVEAQAESDLARYAEVITNRDVVRAQLIENRESTLALLNALRRPVAPAPLHVPGRHRPNLTLLAPVPNEPDSANARRVANRARELQAQLKLSHHAAFRLAEGEAQEQEAA